MKIFYDKDVDPAPLKGKKVSIIGFGNQGEAQALNLRDSGVEVVVGLRSQGASWKRAEEEGFKVLPVSKAAEVGDIIHLLIPDMAQPETYEKEIRPHLTKGKALGFSHGFNIHFKRIVPPPNVDVFMVAPKSPGRRLREMYAAGSGVPALFAVEKNPTGNAEKIALAIAKALGCTRVGVIKTTFKDETESDLVGEQTVLVGGLMELVKKGFEVLVEKGYPPELAYFEACNEAKLIMDLIYERGITGMLNAVSETARYGGLTIGPKILDDRVKENMEKAANQVRSGAFAKAWIEEYNSGRKQLKRLMAKMERHQIEVVGSSIRKMAGIEK